AGDLGPEGMVFIPASESPNRKPLLVVASEVSGTTTIFDLSVMTIEAPSEVTAELQENGDVALEWSDESSGEEGFVIERSVNGGNWIEIGRVFSDVEEFVDESTETSTSYEYRVFAVKGDAYSEASESDESVDTAPERGSVFFGAFEDGESEFGFTIRKNGTAVFIGYMQGHDASIFNLAVEIAEDGAFRFNSETNNLASIDGPTIQATAEISGQIVGMEISGTITGIAADPIAFTGTAASDRGHTEDIAGFYQGVVTDSADGLAYQIIAPDGRVYLYVSNGEFADGGIGVAGKSGSVLARTKRGTNFGLKSDPETGLITGSVSNSDVLAVSVIGFGEGEGGNETLVNSSTRGPVSIGESVMISGFVIEGTENADVLIRGVGPALEEQGVANFLEDPVITLYKESEIVGENDDWISHPNLADLQATADEVGAFPFTRTQRDSALLVNLEPGIYTVHLSTKAGGEGVGLIEVYDASPEGTDAELVNMSTRGQVELDEGFLIMGLVVAGEVPQKVLVQAVGPGIGEIFGRIDDPRLSVYFGQTLVATNDNWGDNTNDIAAIGSDVGATPLEEKDAATVVWLEPGAYTIIVSGVDGATGIALVESYRID
ncbi:fibronectin type III domain-containing protein, partial [Puniceicoccaceae bacterium K14]|nr:fibronectin type III domain-containing protein [Puniceicoccaceae bacterium K14]